MDRPLHRSRKGLSGEALYLPTRSGTTLGLLICRWGALLVADGFQFVENKYFNGPLPNLYENPSTKVTETFKHFCSNYPVSSEECDQLMKGMDQRQDLTLYRSNGKKIFTLGRGSECPISVAIAGHAKLGEEIVLKLDGMAKSLLLTGQVLTIEQCVAYSSTVLSQDFRGKAAHWGLPKGYDMTTFTCSLVFVTCEGNKQAPNVNHVFPKAVLMTKGKQKIISNGFLFVGQGIELADKVLNRHWSYDMTQPAAVSRMKEAFQAASFSTLSGGELTIALMSINDSLFKIIKASAYFTTGNIPWNMHKYGADHYYTNHRTMWRGPWWEADTKMVRGRFLSMPDTTKLSKDGESDKIRFGLSSMQGFPDRMEDDHAAFPYLDNSTSIFGVHDGHGGDLVAKVCAKYLHHEVLMQEAYSAGDLGTSVQRSFLRMDEMMRETWLTMTWSSLREAQIYNWKGPYSSGSTACVAVIRNNRLVVANAGDSRCVLSRRGQGIPADDVVFTVHEASPKRASPNPEQVVRSVLELK